MTDIIKCNIKNLELAKSLTFNKSTHKNVLKYALSCIKYIPNVNGAIFPIILPIFSFFRNHKMQRVLQ